MRAHAEDCFFFSLGIFEIIVRNTTATVETKMI